MRANRHCVGRPGDFVSEAVLHANVLAIDAQVEARRIESRLRDIVGRDLRRRGAVVALSGGVDSSVCGVLALRALGAGRVYGLMLPERESSPDSTARAKELAEQFGIAYDVENIEPALEALGCYRRRDEAIRCVFPEYGAGWKSKIAIAGGREGSFNYFKLIVQSPSGKLHEARLPLREYLQIVAATSFKQRVRKTVEYFHADRLNYAVIGTPNRLEYDQGFFVKNGDGAADVKPIAHLYKTQVYALARYLGVPEEIRNAAPATDTYSLQQGQDEFYFALHYDQMDVALWAYNHQVPAADLASYLGITPAQAWFVYNDIEAKRQTTRYLHARAALVEPIVEIASPS
jgi:NAD+ synthase